MSAASTIRFRDPFVSHKSFTHDQRSWPSLAHRHDAHRALTPPPDMNGVSQPQSLYYRSEHSGHAADSLARHSSYKSTNGAYAPQDMSNAGYGRNGYSTQPASRAMSPIAQARSHTVDDYARAHNNRESQASSIALSFQIPRSVNDSGGSLSELAAQITCLFWFESSDILQQVEDSTFPIAPPRQLVADAKPTTGFMKWVTTILSTTLVAQNVVLLALLFIHRLKKLNPTVRGKPGSEYRLLTVALMLGNKFLDDNTYTNKTWAEVSGINVAEVHIMEVEFLSNMKYCLFTSSQQWTEWQSLLGKFAEFFVRASKPQMRNTPAPILPPASSLHLPMALPSPPSSNQASPPYTADNQQNGPAYLSGQNGPTPAPSPLTAIPAGAITLPNPRKRSHDEHANEHPSKRIASGVQHYQSPHRPSVPVHGPNSQAPRLPLPSLAIPQGQASAGPSSAGQTSNLQSNQLPPLNMSGRAMGMVYPSTQAQQTIPTSTAGPQPASQGTSQYHSRQHSPYPGSAHVSPTNSMPASASALYAPSQVSPTYFLQQRNSPYRPIQGVSKLLYPPPSGALQPRPQSFEQSQMHYQPLGKPKQQRQAGRLPYVAQNVWVDGSNQQHTMTPVSQWPGFNNTTQGQRSVLR